MYSVITIKYSYASIVRANYFNDGRGEKMLHLHHVCIKMCNEWQNRGKIHTMAGGRETERERERE